MSFITDMTRTWLTRSFRPFEFKSEYDKVISYDDEKKLGLYIHIPFCRQICNFCPYCKVLYDKGVADRYIDSLISEIEMYGRMHEGKKQVTSLYFGGGTPVLILDRLPEIIGAVKRNFDITKGIGIELHPENVKTPVLLALREAGITRISIGIQSFQEKFQNTLGRAPVDPEALCKSLSEVSFETVSMDFIFALPGQNSDDLKRDIDLAFSNGANHIAVYPFIDFTFTKSPVKAMEKKEKRRLLDEITNYCFSRGLRRDSIWTFSSDKCSGYSSMTRENFLGFGCSATTLLHDQFKINTFDIDEYCRRIEEELPATSLTLRFSLRQRMVYYLFWTAYSTHVCEDDFEEFFGVSLSRMYGFELLIARLLGFVTKEKNVYSLTLRGAFYYHYYENFYTLSYIDKMWGIMRKEAFPDHIDL